MTKNTNDWAWPLYTHTTTATIGSYIAEATTNTFKTDHWAPTYGKSGFSPPAKSVHFSSAKETWCTPKYVLEWLKPFGDIDLDPCASIIVEKNFALLNYTIEADGLKQSWAGPGLVYVNPPYGRKIKLWTDKAIEEAKLGAEIVLLLPARPDTAWWQRMVKTANAVCFVKGRIKFEGATNGAPFPSAMVYFGARSTLFVDSMASHGWCVCQG